MNIPHSIYSYLKINQNDENIYTKEYFQGLEIEIIHANPLTSKSQQPPNQTGGELPISGPYKYFNYFFNNIKSSKTAATTTKKNSPPPSQPQTQPQTQPPSQNEIFIFIKNTYMQPTQIDTETLDIPDIELLAKILAIQIKIQENNGREFSQISEQDILSINDQFIFFPPYQPQQSQQPNSNARALGTFLQELLEKSAQKQQPSPPQNTKLNYFIKRAIEENVILWI